MNFVIGKDGKFEIKSYEPLTSEWKAVYDDFSERWIIAIKPGYSKGSYQPVAADMEPAIAKHVAALHNKSIKQGAK